MGSRGDQTTVLWHPVMTKSRLPEVRCSAKSLSPASSVSARSGRAAEEVRHPLVSEERRKHTEILEVIVAKGSGFRACNVPISEPCFPFPLPQICVIKPVSPVWSLFKVFFPRVILLLCCIWFLNALYDQTAKLLLLMQQRTMGSLQQCSQNTLLAFFMPGFQQWKK